MIEKGKQVGIEYSVYLEDGMKVDSNEGENPLIFLQGAGQILPALEDELNGLEEGAQKKVELSPEKAYGYVDPDAFKEVDSKVIPDNLRYKGALLGVQDQNGEQYLVRVHEVNDERTVIDFNHPLAGHTLTFDIKVLTIK